MFDIKKIRLIAFDADDTLWDCQSFYDEAEKSYIKILEQYGITPEEASLTLFATETKNMPLLGYGCKAFILSLIENAVNITDKKIKGEDVMRILELSDTLLTSLGEPLKGVKETLKQLRSNSKIPLIVFTKGELLDQKNKYLRSGLSCFFDSFIVVEDKTHEEYNNLCHSFGVKMEELLMIGNSFKSDIKPVLKLGGSAIHIPFHTVWKHEVVKEFPHDNLLVLKSFSDLTRFLL
ncbi:HAD family hydrolase [Prevotella amnii]|uniref:HAD family hydrolase n=2 Tax=Prevotella amnii TaxID=419005 RepID=A0A096B0Y4_9BACT|nr:HAD family hydrolase [Prevotella amnii]EFN90585.1 haloacid dehalogenase-like hydrolase [Prevotella amnii CRIS 21A-A]KGF52621.1 HAD family hydrolase [Prevotella amnii DNF00058]